MAPEKLPAHHHYKGTDLLKERPTLQQASLLEERITGDTTPFRIDKEGYIYPRNPSENYPTEKISNAEQLTPIPVAHIKRGSEQTKFFILNTEIAKLNNEVMNYHHILREIYWQIIN